MTAATTQAPGPRPARARAKAKIKVPELDADRLRGVVARLRDLPRDGTGACALTFGEAAVLRADLDAATSALRAPLLVAEPLSAWRDYLASTESIPRGARGFRTLSPNAVASLAALIETAIATYSFTTGR